MSLWNSTVAHLLTFHHYVTIRTDLSVNKSVVSYSACPPARYLSIDPLHIFDCFSQERFRYRPILLLSRRLKGDCHREFSFPLDLSSLWCKASCHIVKCFHLQGSFHLCNQFIPFYPFVIRVDAKPGMSYFCDRSLPDYWLQSVRLSTLLDATLFHFNYRYF